MKRITKIKANEPAFERPKKKVAAYCRVSTVSDEQLISLAAQKAHYEKQIKTNPESGKKRQNILQIKGGSDCHHA